MGEDGGEGYVYKDNFDQTLAEWLANHRDDDPEVTKDLEAWVADLPWGRRSVASVRMVVTATTGDAGRLLSPPSSVPRIRPRGPESPRFPVASPGCGLDNGTVLIMNRKLRPDMGAVPPPEVLRAYDVVRPGLAARILSLAERHRDLADRQLAVEGRRRDRLH